jgi:hypothetical protein
VNLFELSRVTFQLNHRYPTPILRNRDHLSGRLSVVLVSSIG